MTLDRWLGSWRLEDVAAAFYLLLFGMALLSSVLPPLDAIASHGKTQQVQSFFNHRLLLVRKRWFTLFYATGIVSTCYFWQPTAVHGLFLLHVVRRFYECCWVHRFRGNMHVAGLLVGVLYYVFLPVLLSTPTTEQSWSTPAQAPWILLALWAQYQQHRHHVILANLRSNNNTPATRYTLPRGGWFRSVACPHYTAELVLYVALTMLDGSSFRLWVVLPWVVTHLGQSAWHSHQWYRGTFGNEYRVKYALIPGVW